MAGASSTHASRILAGRYRLIRIAGKGGMGVVWEALDEPIDRRVAIKLVLPAHSEDEHLQRLARLELERRVLIDLSQHPGIVTLFDVLTEPLGYVMEWLEGYDLESWLAANPGPRPPLLVANIFAQILDAVGYAHAHGVIHRDLKSSNIFLQNLGDRTSVRVMDFGLARIVQQESSITTGRFLLGTPQYMAPEQVLGETPTPATDIYALGVLLYECLTGELPLEERGESPVPMLMDKIRNELPSPQGKYSELSDELSAVIVKATRLSADERYSSCSDFADALFAALPQSTDRNTMRLDSSALGVVPQPYNPTDSAETLADTSNISYATLYGHHQDASSTRTTTADTHHGHTTLLSPPPKDTPTVVGEDLEPQQHTIAHRIAALVEKMPSRRHLIMLALTISFALILLIGMALRKNDAAQGVEDITKVEGIPWLIYGDKERRDASLSAMFAYKDIIEDWNEGAAGNAISAYREPIRCYYNQKDLAPQNIPINAFTRTVQGMPAAPFEPQDILISQARANDYVTFVEQGVAGRARQKYIRVVQLTRRNRHSQWRVNVEATRTAHDCYDSFEVHYQKWINRLSDDVRTGNSSTASTQ